MSITWTLRDQWDDTKRLHAIGEVAFSGSYTTGGDAISLAIANADTSNTGEGGVRSSLTPQMIIFHRKIGYDFVYKDGADITAGHLQVFYGTASVAASGTLTSDNTNNSDGDTVTIGSTTYTFKTTLAGVANQIHIGASADASLTNLVSAITGAGTPGTDYTSNTPVNTQVTAGAVSAHATTVTALLNGSAGNSIATTKSATHLSWGAATLTSGADAKSGGTELGAGAYPSDILNITVKFHAWFLKYQ